MKGYKEPGFQERTAASDRAKKKALERMKAAPKPTEAELAERVARRAERDAKAESKRAAAAEAKEQEREKALEAERKRAELKAAEPTEAERKIARDERYAARKERKRRKS